MTRNIIAIIIAFALVPVMAWLDRQRGDPTDIAKPLALVSMGYICALYTGHVFDWQAVAITLSVAVAHNFGLGEPLGHALTGTGGHVAADGSTYEWYQIGGVLKSNPWAALTVRGLLVGVATLTALDPIASLKIGLAFGVAFPLASLITTRILKMGGEGWAIQEEVRGGLIGLLLFLMWAITLAAGAALGML